MTAAACGGAGSGGGASATAGGASATAGGATVRGSSAADRFDAAATMRLIRLQIGYGQRPAGSPQLRRLAVRLKALLPHGRFEAIPGESRLRNVVGSLPGTGKAVVLGAHYDTLVKPKGFVGANNGASGSAIVIEAARALAKIRRPRGAPPLRFVLFDGEEPAVGLPEEQADFYSTGLRGSRAYAKANAASTQAMVLLDYVAGRGLQLPREGSSTPELWAKLRAAARRAGAIRFFPPGTGVSIVDDHAPFLRAGIPAVDLIDWNYPGHSLRDGLKLISPKAADGVGETVVELLRTYTG